MLYFLPIAYPNDPIIVRAATEVQLEPGTLLGYYVYALDESGRELLRSRDLVNCWLHSFRQRVEAAATSENDRFRADFIFEQHTIQRFYVESSVVAPTLLDRNDLFWQHGLGLGIYVEARTVPTQEECTQLWDSAWGGIFERIQAVELRQIRSMEGGSLADALAVLRTLGADDSQPVTNAGSSIFNRRLLHEALVPIHDDPDFAYIEGWEDPEACHFTTHSEEGGEQKWVVPNTFLLTVVAALPKSTLIRVEGDGLEEMTRVAAVLRMTHQDGAFCWVPDASIPPPTPLELEF